MRRGNVIFIYALLVSSLITNLCVSFVALIVDRVPQQNVFAESDLIRIFSWISFGIFVVATIVSIVEERTAKDEAVRWHVQNQLRIITIILICGILASVQTSTLWTPSMTWEPRVMDVILWILVIYIVCLLISGATRVPSDTSRSE